jgi:glycosyltransferase involved in cell wall biosynthesis
VRILHLYKDYFPVLGGIENHLRVLAERQAAEGHQVTALVCGRGPVTAASREGGVMVERSARLATVASMPISIAQPWRVRTLRADVTHVHSPYPLGEAANWFWGRTRATVLTYHTDIIRQRAALRLYAPILRRVLASADRILVTSPRYLDSSTWLRPVRERCRVVPLGVDAARFRPGGDPAEGAALRLLFVGRLRYYKGLDTLLAALPSLPHAHLRVVGEGPMRRGWEAMASSLGLSGRVDFTGEATDEELPGLYRSAHAFVLPAASRGEAFGTVLLEAMASGLPCVTTEVGSGTSWIVQDGATGYVVPSRSPSSLAEAIRRLEDPLRRAEMGQAGRRRVEELFTEERMLENVMDAYREVT